MYFLRVFLSGLTSVGNGEHMLNTSSDQKFFYYGYTSLDVWLSVHRLMYVNG